LPLSITADSLAVSKPTWWLESRFHFSFAGYYNPDNTNFGALRVSIVLLFLLWHLHHVPSS